MFEQQLAQQESQRLFLACWVAVCSSFSELVPFLEVVLKGHQKEASHFGAPSEVWASQRSLRLLMTRSVGVRKAGCSKRERCNHSIRLQSEICGLSGHAAKCESRRKVCFRFGRLPKTGKTRGNASPNKGYRKGVYKRTRGTRPAKGTAPKRRGTTALCSLQLLGSCVLPLDQERTFAAFR